MSFGQKTAGISKRHIIIGNFFIDFIVTLKSIFVKILLMIIKQYIFTDKIPMAVFLCVLLCLCTNINITASEQAKPIYKLPPITASEAVCNDMITGTDSGLYRIVGFGTAVPLWTKGQVTQIAHCQYINEQGKKETRWYFITSQGLLTSTNLEIFETCNNGLPSQVIKQYDGKEVQFIKHAVQLKDICIDPANHLKIVTATKDSVYITYDGGKNWKALGSMSTRTTGIKAVAVADLPVGNSLQTVVFMSHPIFGFSYMFPESSHPKWYDVSTGFESMKTLSSSDEIADILPVLRTDESNKTYTEIYVSQSFLPRLYKFNWQKRSAELIWKENSAVGTIDGMTSVGNVILYSTMDNFGAVKITDHQSAGVPENLPRWQRCFSIAGKTLNAAWIPQSLSGFGQSVSLNELWMLNPQYVRSDYAEDIKDARSLYIPANHCRTVAEITKYRALLKKNNLNTVVIDMKDDHGLLRYDTKDPLVKKKGYVSEYAINLDTFVKEFKKDNVHLIARIVVFKDRNLARYGKSEYAVWDNTTKKPWKGIKRYKEETDAVTGKITKTPEYYDEQWVDPYCPQVWEYDVAIAKELISRGFDEIQFDYIRFPTDGYNLNHAYYRYQSHGMDKESALISFLSYARKNINAPIGIDIYGANGWYRSGARTGQDVELLSQYVDVICPMFYPSHFEQIFLNYKPYAERPYRIYFYGTYRNSVISRNRSLIRPWVQAFRLNVSYDRTYYNKDYVKREIYGIRDSVDRGYMYWNNMGDYSMLSPDVGDSPYPWDSYESESAKKKSVFGKKTVKSTDVVGSIPHKIQCDNFAVLNNVLANGRREEEEKERLKNSPLFFIQTLFRSWAEPIE